MAYPSNVDCELGGPIGRIRHFIFNVHTPDMSLTRPFQSLSGNGLSQRDIQKFDEGAELFPVNDLFPFRRSSSFVKLLLPQQKVVAD